MSATYAATGYPVVYPALFLAAGRVIGIADGTFTSRGAFRITALSAQCLYPRYQRRDARTTLNLPELQERQHRRARRKGEIRCSGFSVTVYVTGSQLKNNGYVQDTNSGRNYMFERLDVSAWAAIYGSGGVLPHWCATVGTVGARNRDSGTSFRTIVREYPVLYHQPWLRCAGEDHPQCVSFEIGSRKSQRVQFSVERVSRVLRHRR